MIEFIGHLYNLLQHFTNTGLPFTIADGPRQRSHTWARVPRDSWLYFTLSDSRLPQSGGPGPRIYIAQEQGGPITPPGTGFPSLSIRPGFLVIWSRVGLMDYSPLPKNERLLLSRIVVCITYQRVVYQESVSARTCLSSLCLTMDPYVTVSFQWLPLLV
jgi:hypothetical protein